MNKLFAFRCSALLFFLITSGASAHAEKVSLDDCNLLLAKPVRADLQALLNKNRRLAAEGNADSKKLLAAEANNRLACFEEKLTENSGWAVTMTSADGSSETSSTPGIPNIKKNPEAFAALKDAVKYTHDAGAGDPAYRDMSAQIVLRYLSTLPESLETAYEDIAGANHLECVLKRKFGKRDTKFVCASQRSSLAQLSVKLPADRRAALDARAQQWAENLSAK